SQLETLTGGAGLDIVTLATAGFDSAADMNRVSGTGGNTLLVSGLETLTGSSGNDVVYLGSAGNTLLVSG
ncbi:hypothetical protein, partial [Azospirillum sp. TSH64]|uniref:hypothetical protein n=1 Tax=Azospirillum sp. TSH64 TaxID=652740 RepID=UPI0018EE497F